MNKFLASLNRKIVNDPKLQYGIVSFFVGLALLNLGFVVALLITFKNKVLFDLTALDPSSQNNLQLLVESWSPVVLNSVLMFGGFVIVVSFFSGLLLLQQISGPAYVIKKYLQQTLEGRIERKPIRLRKYDFFKDLADLINEIDNKYTYIEKNKRVTDSQ
jgi:hypothetical protein